jgi:hypothetical protein
VGAEQMHQRENRFRLVYLQGGIGRTRPHASERSEGQ